jgi:hypothetical protein
MMASSQPIDETTNTHGFSSVQSTRSETDNKLRINQLSVAA